MLSLIFLRGHVINPLGSSMYCFNMINEYMLWKTKEIKKWINLFFTQDTCNTELER